MTGSLRELVLSFADDSTDGNQAAFFRGLVASQVAVPLRAVPPAAAPGTDQVADGRQWSIPTTRGPDGRPMLLVYTDQQAAMQAPGAKAAFGVAGRVVLEMARANQAGVIVATGYGAASSWAGVAPQDVAALLAREDARAEQNAAADRAGITVPQSSSPPSRPGS
jgi:hypothetical protein